MSFLGNFPDFDYDTLKLSRALTSGLPVRHWPNNCPDCGMEMEFRFPAGSEDGRGAWRECPGCGATVADRDGSFENAGSQRQEAA